MGFAPGAWQGEINVRDFIQRKMHDDELTRVTELVQRIRRYRGIFTASGGGVTLSGGEPLMQPAVVALLLIQCRALGVHTALDTSGHLGARGSDALLDNVDLVLLDVKSGLPDTVF